ncbi:hypothetical protein GPECTOR_81g215 [Gonium pectorale]|uniref:OBG-type G domain-containing protein n=1 Tax=Gonium pectorale TaxID=33097 RepID=A0A150G2M7_GONPE|nr:hypothetical protein GPECTOR_81g215 [Gonium pectorale]|eukprot:KXZ43765.1 hypothetical protein GPECTOR_81g215 [Gonium pectorale]
MATRLCRAFAGAQLGAGRGLLHRVVISSSPCVSRPGQGSRAFRTTTVAALQAGIVGLPNVGKSTLFNALVENGKAQAANFPFCTIEPNVGIVQVADPRLQTLSSISGSKDIIPATVEFVDIAGLVKGASRGEGMGNQFLTNIRNTDAVCQVVRCFEDDDIIHVAGKQHVGCRRLGDGKGKGGRAREGPAGGVGGGGGGVCEKETRAWTIRKGMTAPQAAGVIHTDFEKGFIRAETVAYDDYVKHNGYSGAKEAGALRLEGKEYVVQEGDVMLFRFNV